MTEERNGGSWTSSRFFSFVKSALRSASTRWPPKYETKKAAWVRRGVYTCAGYKRKPHEAQAKDVAVDHINPVIDPETGFTTWDDLIDRMFCEADGFQVLCKECHKQKTADERELRKKNRKPA